MSKPVYDEASLKKIADSIVADGKGLLAADESTGSIKKRFDKVGKENTEEHRRAWRDTLFTASPDLGKYLGGIITFEETLGHKTNKGEPFPDVLTKLGVVVGVKTDKGLVDLLHSNNEQTSEGLDGLGARLEKYWEQGARFTKHRCVFTITESTPSHRAIETNSEVLARYASICQSKGFVPIVEPEILMDGAHDTARSVEASIEVLSSLFRALARHKLYLPGLLLKPAMAHAGTEFKGKITPEEVAAATYHVLSSTVPPATAGVVFLSGGMSDTESIFNLDAINRYAKSHEGFPWPVSFSYGRALQGVAMQKWAEGDVESAKKLFVERAKWCWQAARGELDPKELGA